MLHERLPPPRGFVELSPQQKYQQQKQQQWLQSISRIFFPQHDFTGLFANGCDDCCGSGSRENELAGYGGGYRDKKSFFGRGRASSLSSSSSSFSFFIPRSSNPLSSLSSPASVSSSFAMLNGRWLSRQGARLACFLVAALLIIPNFFIAINLNLRFEYRDWITSAEFAVPPTHGCFSKAEYANATALKSAAQHPVRQLHPALVFQQGKDCFKYAGSFQTPAIPKEEVIFHTYWRADLRTFERKQLGAVRSFFATQNPQRTVVYFWTNDAAALKDNEHIAQLQLRFRDRFHLMQYDNQEMAKNSPVEGSDILSAKDRRAWLDGDLCRLLVLFRYGGVWFDLDTMFIRDISPLLDYEFVHEFDCFKPNGIPFNGAMMRFEKHSPYLCEFLTEIASMEKPWENSFGWGAELYNKMYRRLVNEGLPPFNALPWCFTEPSLCNRVNAFPSMFESAQFDAELLKSSFAFHWHNNYDAYIHEDSIFAYLERQHQRKLELGE